MEIDTLKFKNKIFIEGYGINKFKISGDIYKSPILILKNKVIEKKNLKLNSLKKDFLLKIISNYKLDFLILGIEKEITKKIQSYNRETKIELMKTSSACRTLNILLSDNRNIGGLLFPIT